MTSPVELRLARAREGLGAATSLRAAGYPTQALSRLYYAVFHAATAALLDVGQSRATHSGALAGFAQFVVRDGGFAPDVARTFRTLFERRNRADYIVEDADVGDLDGLQDRAVRFVAAVAAWLER